MDHARLIQSLLEKLTEDEKDAFNFLIETARGMPPRPRRYYVTWQGRKIDHAAFTATSEVWAYTRTEAMEQVKLDRAVDRSTDASVIVLACDPSPPE